MAAIKKILRFVLSIMLLALLIYGIVLAAGRWDWIELWIILATYLIVFSSWTLYLKLKNPELLHDLLSPFLRFYFSIFFQNNEAACNRSGPENTPEASESKDEGA